MELISTAYAEGAAAPQAGGDFSMIIVLAVCMIAVYFFIMRPNNKKRKEMQKLLDNLAVGDEVLTNGGIAGRIIKLPDNREYVLVEVCEGTVLQMKRNYVVAVLPKGTLLAVAVDKKSAPKGAAKNEKKAEEKKTELPPAVEKKLQGASEDKTEEQKA
ncbi:MAG: preprotein translocase subunit YajC [Succinivibrio sp.]|jgi:preprotein translocase subunit YajC|nr:preprotein translocase subunit YajC [Succinivibrio sp.]